MKLLELFSGTKSVGKVAEQLGYEVTSLDRKNADINCDIMNWNYTVYESRYFAAHPKTSIPIPKYIFNQS